MEKNEKLINELKGLYKQNIDYIASMTNGTSEKHYKKKTIAGFKKLNEQLNDYIQDIEYGLDCDKTAADWCELFGDVLMDNSEGLDDDNFPKGGW